MRKGNRTRAGGPHRRRGASATELAIILPLFITIVLGCVDFARFAYTYIALSNAVRAGAAWEMLHQPNNMTTTNPQPAPPGPVMTAGTWQNSLQTAVTNEMSQQPGFQSSSLTVVTATPPTLETATTPNNWRFTVTASYPFQTLVTWNLGGYGIPSSFTLTQQVTMRGIRYSPPS